MIKAPMYDAWVNPNFPTRTVDPTVSSLFPGLEARRHRGTTLEQLIEEMDAAGVRHAILCAGYRGADNLSWVIDAVQERPDRLSASIALDPRQGMTAVRLLDKLVTGHGFVMARVMALETQLPYDHASYFPVYAKCAELGVPLSVNVGIPGPRVPGRCQDPLALDEVCYFFPELTLVMAHGGDPWGDMCVKLMTKWPNLYYMSSAYSPRRIPEAILNYLNGPGSDRVMWASDYPILEFQRCRDIIDKMEFSSQETKHRFMHDNASRVLGAPATPSVSPTAMELS